jgi:hypothetical protein
MAASNLTTATRSAHLVTGQSSSTRATCRDWYRHTYATGVFNLVGVATLPSDEPS